MLPDDQLDALLRQAKPNAPAGFEDRVMSRVSRPRHLWMFAAAAVVVLAIAGVGSLFMARGGAHAPQAMMPVGSPHVVRLWYVAGDVAKHVEGPAELSQPPSSVSLSAGGSIDVVEENLVLRAGTAILNGEAILLGTPVASVMTRTPDAQVEVAMNAKKVGASVAIAATAAVVTIHVLRGKAEIMPHTGETSGEAVVLAQGDRALVTARRPPAVLRASHPTTPPAATAMQKPAPRPTDKPVAIQPPKSPPAAAITPADEPGSLDKETIRTGIRTMIPRVHECYSKGLERNPKLAGKIVVKFVIRSKDGRGRIDEAEMDPESDELQSPLVEQCILNAIAEVDFPAPSGGGEVHVSYPFVLANDGEPSDQSRKTDRNR